MKEILFWLSVFLVYWALLDFPYAMLATFITAVVVGIREPQRK